jgi:ABC-2 type transport system permease protein
MTAATVVENSRPTRRRRRISLTAFFAILRRDIVVTVRDFASFLVQCFMQPLFFLFIFGKVLPSIGLTTSNFTALMLPGVVAFTALTGSLTGVMMPLVIDMGFGREIDDRILSPLPVKWVALEKILFGTLRGTVASAVIFPLGWIVLGSGYHVRADRIPEIAGMIILTASAGAALGLLLGASAKPEQIGVIVTVIYPPLLFTGCTYYPWSALKSISWFQTVTLFNPLTYCSEGLRHAMVPSFHGHDLATLEFKWILLALFSFIIVARRIGARIFYARIVS